MTDFAIIAAPVVLAELGSDTWQLSGRVIIFVARRYGFAQHWRRDDYSLRGDAVAMELSTMPSSGAIEYISLCWCRRRCRCRWCCVALAEYIIESPGICVHLCTKWWNVYYFLYSVTTCIMHSSGNKHIHTQTDRETVRNTKRKQWYKLIAVPFNNFEQCRLYTVFQKKHPLILLVVSWGIVVWF